MKLAVVAAILVLPAAAPPAGHPSGAGWSVSQVRVHRGSPAGMGRWHHWPDRRHEDRGGSAGHGYGGGYAGGGYGYEAPPQRPSRLGFFEDGDSWAQGHGVVYDYDRGYPYEHYRHSRLRRHW